MGLHFTISFKDMVVLPYVLGPLIGGALAGGFVLLFNLKFLALKNQGAAEVDDEVRPLNDDKAEEGWEKQEDYENDPPAAEPPKAENE